MTLRVRLLLGYGYLVALLLLATGSAMLGFLQLSESVDVVLEENLFSIHSSMHMLESLERQDSVTLAALLDGDAHRAELERQDAAFHQALGEAADNITEDAEGPVLEAIRGSFDTYRQHRDEILRRQPERPLREYNERVFPAFRDVKQQVLELLEINQQAVIEADRRAREAAVRNGAWLGFLVAFALVSLVFLSRALQRQLLSRLHGLRRDLAALGADRRRHLRVTGNDELAQVARQVNDLLDDLQAERARHRGRLAEERRTLLALLHHLGGAALFDRSGQMLASSDEREAPLPPELRRWIEREGEAHLEAALDSGGGDVPAATVTAGGVPWRLEALRNLAGRPVGWLARSPD